jgi:hypothetical protein
MVFKVKKLLIIACSWICQWESHALLATLALVIPNESWYSVVW